MFSNYNGQVVTSNDVIIFEFYKNKKGKAKARDELSFFCGLHGMKMELDDDFQPTYEINVQSFYQRSTTYRDIHKIQVEFGIEASKQLDELKNEIVNNNYSKEEFISVLKKKLKDETLLMSKHFYRTVLYKELFKNHAERFYDYAKEV